MVDLEIEAYDFEAGDGRLVYSKLKKYFILGLVSIAGLLGPISSTIYFPSSTSVINDLKTTSAMFDLTIGAFMITLGIMPLIWGGIADRYGRKWVYVTSLLIATIGNIRAGLSKDISELIGLRVVQAIGTSGAMVTGVGVITDIFPKEDIGTAMSIFFVGILIGPIIGPILGGFLDSTLGWASTFFFLAILSGSTTIIFLLFYKETLPRANKKVFPIKIQARPLRIQRGGPLFNPFSALMYLRYPSIFLSGTITAISFGVFFAVESFHSRAMAEIYRLRSNEVGLTFMVLGFGSAVGNFAGGRLSDILSRRSRDKNDATLPEARLRGVWACILVLCFGMISYGWSLETKQELWVPLVAMWLLGFGYTSACIGATAYFVELVPNYASSVSAATSILRLGFATLLSSSNSLVIEYFGYGIGISIYASISLIALVLTLLLIFKGPQIRAKTGPQYLK